MSSAVADIVDVADGAPLNAPTIEEDGENLPTTSPRRSSLSSISSRRDTWDKKADFLFSVIGFVVDLGNLWRFPYFCYKHGGGAFFIPYLIMFALAGVPLFYMELAIGQFNRIGAISCWDRMCPLFKGVGYAVVLIAIYVDFYYNVMISWSLYLFFDSFADDLPWSNCNNSWNTPSCRLASHAPSEISLSPAVFSESTLISLQMNNSNSTGFSYTKYSTSSISSSISPSPDLNGTYEVMPSLRERASPTEEYFVRGMLELHRSSGVEELGTVRWDLAMCLLTVYLLCYFSLWRGILVSGKVVWLTCVCPYFILLIFFVRGVTLSGAINGIKFYLTPEFGRLLSPEIWSDAAFQVFFSLGPGFGVLLTYASYNDFDNNIYNDALITSTVNSLTSFVAGFVIFSVLGHMAEKTGTSISNTVNSGPNLVYSIYPEAISSLPGSHLWSALFFSML